MDVRTAIRARFSVRRYRADRVPEATLEAVVGAGEESLALDDTIPVRFHLVREGRLVAERMTPLTGTRLLFGSAPHFIVATSEERPSFMLNMGFRMEQMVLFATGQDLGTCWIGGMFREETVRALLGLGREERVIALTPLGYPDRSLYGRMTHAAMHIGRRKPLREIAFGRHWGSPLETEDAEFVEALECARLSPSWANTQPWRFLTTVQDVIVIGCPTRKYGNVRHGKHYYRLDVGIAMAHFYLAAREMGWQGEWNISDFDTARLRAERGVPPDCEILGVYRRHRQTT